MTIDQHFLTDETVINRMIELLDIKPNETVLDLGAGNGAITRNLNCKVIAVEKDPLLAARLRKLPVTVIEGDALEVSLGCDKLIGNIPFTVAESLMHRFCLATFSRAVLLVPIHFTECIMGNATTFSSIVQAFFEIDVKDTVYQESLSPRPCSKMCLMVLDRNKNCNNPDYYLRELFLQKDKRVKNALREAHVRLNHGTKRMGQSFVSGLRLDTVLLNKRILALSDKECCRLIHALNIYSEIHP